MMSLRTASATLYLATLLASVVEAGNTVWVEAEQFAERGGWVNDAQFIDQMGSPYLLAVGMGSPVDDACTTILVPKSGTYRVWARTKDWVPEHHPGRFQVLLDDVALDRTFGESGKAGWQWESGGTCKLAEGKVKLSLHDLTGYYGRCDAIVLTDDLNWLPPAEVAAIATLRERHGGVSREVQKMPAADVVVVGGGLAGCTAAVAAARNGARTVLIQNRPLLGGNASTEILVPPVGVWPGIWRRQFPLDPRETGLVEEYRTLGNQRIAEGKLYSERLLRFVQLEPNLALHLNTHATGVEMHAGEEKRIAAVLAVDVNTGRRLRFPGSIFIDCTGDAVVGVAAGADYRHGKEPKSMYNEPWAPEVANEETMGNGLKYFAQDTGSPQPFQGPAWAYKFPSCKDFSPGRHPKLPRSSEIGWQWVIELGGMRDTYDDAEEIRDDLWRLIFGLWDHTKNHCTADKERAAGYKLVWVGYVTGKRENRRLLGDYVLTQNDIGAQTLFSDRVAFGGWIVDDHYSGGFFYKGSLGTHYDDREHAYQGVPFSIPFRCLYSRNVGNLLMAGRNISASHLALADTRVMLTCAIIGHAVGTASALCSEEGTLPRVLGREHIGRLQQQLLKEGAYLIGLKANDPRDLAPKAKLSASSTRVFDSETMAAGNVTNGFARATDGKTNAWSPDPATGGPHWIELTWPEAVTFNMVHVCFQNIHLVPRAFAIQAWLAGRWQTLADVKENRHRRHVLGLDPTSTSRLRVTLGQPAGICEIRVYNEPERQVEIARRAHHNMRRPDRGPWLPWKEISTGHKYGGIVIDASAAEQIGEWVSSNWAGPFIEDGYLHDDKSGKGSKSITFRPNLERPGTYEVRLSYVAATNRASNTPVTIRHAGGTKTVRINQRQKPPIEGLFFSLGKFALDGKSSISVSNAETEGYVVVDALQLIIQK